MTRLRKFSETHRTHYDARGRIEAEDTTVEFLVAPFTGEGRRIALDSIEIVRAIVAAHDHFGVPERAVFTDRHHRVIEFWWPQ